MDGLRGLTVMRSHIAVPVLVAALLGVGLLAASRTGTEPVAARSPRAPTGGEGTAPVRRGLAPTPGGPRDRDEPPPAAATLDERLADPDVLVRPHPLTPAHARLTAQQRLFAGVEAALARDDFAQVRVLLAEHRAEFSGEDAWTDWREGFARLADCREHPGPASRAAGQRFVDTERASALRRRVRRACLPTASGPDPAPP